MPQLPPAMPGMPMSDVDTPALIIDLDAFERNLKRMADTVAKSGVRIRPHAKTHKSPVIGLKQMALGAVGLCCQKVSEAEAMVLGGISDVLISNEVVGARKLDRLCALAHQARVMVAVDNEIAIEQLAAAAMRAGVKIRVLVEIDVGANRCGVGARRAGSRAYPADRARKEPRVCRPPGLSWPRPASALQRGTSRSDRWRR